MPDIYLHYGEDSVNNKLMDMSDIDTEERRESKKREQLVLKPQKCPNRNCKQVNPVTALFCSCGCALERAKVEMRNAQRRQQADDMMNELFADPEFKSLLANYLKSKSVHSTAE